MTQLVFYNSKGVITRAMSSSRPKSKWDLSIYGLDEGEQMKLFNEAELPNDFSQSNYCYDGNNFTKVEPEPVRDYSKEIDELKARLDKIGR